MNDSGKKGFKGSNIRVSKMNEEKTDLKEQVDKKQFHMPIIGVCVWHRVFLSNVECHLQSSTKNCVISYKKFLLVGKSDVCNS